MRTPRGFGDISRTNTVAPTLTFINTLRWSPAEGQDPTCAGYDRWPSARQGPLLVGAAVAVPDLQLGTVGRGESGVVQAPPGLGADHAAVGARAPLLVGTAVTVPQLDQRAVARTLPGHIGALAVDP